MHSALAPEGFAISVNLHVVLPRSPFDAAPVSYHEPYNAAVSELVVRPRSQSHSQAYLRGSYADSGVKGHGLLGQERLLEEGEDIYDREEENEDDEEEEDAEDEEEEEEDMPFAWVDHSMIATQTFESKSKSEGSEGHAGDREQSVEGKTESSSPSFSQKGVGYSIGLPPSLISFPDAHWYDSGSAVSYSPLISLRMPYVPSL